MKLSDKGTCHTHSVVVMHMNKLHINECIYFLIIMHACDLLNMDYFYNDYE